MPIRGVVDEDGIANTADVYLADLARHDRLDRLVQIERNLEILREVIERAEWQHSKRRRSTDQFRGDRIYGTVATAGHNRIGMLFETHTRGA